MLSINYYGGKVRLAEWIISHFPKHTTYIEPFGGGAAVLLNKPRSKNEIYNDKDNWVVNFFWVLREQWDEFIHKATLLEASKYLELWAKEVYKKPIEIPSMEHALAFWWSAVYSVKAPKPDSLDLVSRSITTFNTSNKLEKIKKRMGGKDY